MNNIVVNPEEPGVSGSPQIRSVTSKKKELETIGGVADPEYSGQHDPSNFFDTSLEDSLDSRPIAGDCFDI